MFKRYRIAAYVASLGLLLTGETWAQGSPAPAPARSAPAAVPVDSDPTATTAAFGDWVLRCVKLKDLPNRVCEVAQSIVVEGQTAPLAQIAIGRAAPRDNLRLTLALPNNVTLTATPRISSGEDDKQPTVMAWQRCIPGGCLADAAFSDALRDRWRKASTTNSITFTEGAGRAISVPFSLRGLAQALDALGSD